VRRDSMASIVRWSHPNVSCSPSSTNRFRMRGRS
jgi:hypothetical protein